MPTIQHQPAEVLAKVVYYGPGLSGKTATLQQIYDATKPAFRGRWISVKNATQRTLFLDFLPIELGKFRDYRVQLHLCSAPGQITQDTARQLILRHCDAVVLVLDATPSRLDANAFALRNLKYNLAIHEVDLDRIPLVVQVNKSDVPGALKPIEMLDALGLPEDLPAFATCAETGQGVFNALKNVSKQLLHLVSDPTQLPEGRVELYRKPREQRIAVAAPLSEIRALKPLVAGATPQVVSANQRK